MENVEWRDSFNHENIYGELRSTDYSNLSTHYDINNDMYLTVNNMIVSKCLQYGNPNPFNNGGYTCATNLNSSYYFYDSSINDTQGACGGVGASIPTGIGGFYITDDAGGNKYTIPFPNLTPTIGSFYENQFNWLGDIWIIHYGWAVNGIFVFDIYQQTGQPHNFKINFTGRYTSQGYNATDYSNYGNVNKSFQIGDSNNSVVNLYTHFRWFHSSDSVTKTTYSLVPYQSIGNNTNPFVITHATTQYRQVLGYSSGNPYYGYWNSDNIEQVSTISMQYGCTLYLQWGKQLAGRTLETDVQGWIQQDLQMGANLKMCNYLNPMPMSDFIGKRTTREINVSAATMYNDSVVSWNAITPSNSYVQIESNVSLDDGIHWMGWETVTNGGPIPQLANGINISNCYIKFRETLYAPDENNLPKLYSLSLLIVSPVLKYLIADGNDIKTYKYNYDWVEYPYNATGFMETNTYPTPYEATCSSVFNSSYMAFEAFNHTNDNSYDCWASENGSTTGWVQYDFGEGYGERLYRYVVTSRNNSDTTSAPKSWTLQASNDGSTWTLIDTQTNQINWAQAESRMFDVTVSKVYRYYKMNITANNGNISYVSLGELELYPLRYQVVSGSWVTIPNAKIDKATFDQYGFENIVNISCDQLYLLNDIKLYTSINNLFYAPVIDYRGFKKVSIRDIVKIKEKDVILKEWSNFSIDKYQSAVTIDSKLIESVTPKTVQIITESLSGNIVEKDMLVKLTDDKPTITAQMINTMLKCTISDKNGDRIRYNVKLNDTIVYPKIGQFTEWLSGTINYRHTFTSKEFVYGKVNTVSIYVEDEYGLSNSTLLTFKGEYGNILFMDENGNPYNNDVGGIVQYIDFGQMFSGNKSDVKKITFVNNNGYAVKNIHLTAAQPYANDKLEFSFTNNPFVTASELMFQQTFYPQQQSSFYVRLNTSLSETTTTEMYTIRVSAEPIN